MDAPFPSGITETALAERLRRAGLRATRPRLLLLALLSELGGHRSADDLFQVLQARGVVFPRASVFNVLNDLARHGLLMIADAGPGRTLYEVYVAWHHHFVCRVCGCVIDVPCDAKKKDQPRANLPGAEVDEAQVIFRGRCPDCAKG